MSVDVLLILPIVLPLIGAVVLTSTRRRRRLQPMLATVLCVPLVPIALAILWRASRAGVLVSQAGSWEAPFGISLAADVLSGLMLVAAAAVSTAVVICSATTIDAERVRLSYFPLIFVVVAGVNGCFLTGDFFNLYVWFEVMLIGSFGLMAVGSERPQLEGVLKYAVVSIVGSTLFLIGVALLYSMTGTLNMADVSRVSSGMPGDSGLRIAATVLLLAFAVKSAAFPMYGWLPASYPTPPAPVAALLAGLLTKVGIYAMLRMDALVLGEDALVQTFLAWLAALTMFAGAVGALTQIHIRRVLAFVLVATVGHMLVGVALLSTMGATGTAFYLVEDAFAITALFLLAGAAEHAAPSGLLREMGGWYRSKPVFAVAFLLPALSIGGIPPLPGFWSKLILVRAGIESGAYGLVAALVGSGLIILAVHARVWQEAFLKPAPPGVRESQLPRGAVASGAVLVAVLICVGLVPGVLYEFAESAAMLLLDPRTYVEAVLAP